MLSHPENELPLVAGLIPIACRQLFPACSPAGRNADNRADRVAIAFDSVQPQRERMPRAGRAIGDERRGSIQMRDDEVIEPVAVEVDTSQTASQLLPAKEGA